MPRAEMIDEREHVSFLPAHRIGAQVITDSDRNGFFFHLSAGARLRPRMRDYRHSTARRVNENALGRERAGQYAVGAERIALYGNLKSEIQNRKSEDGARKGI